MMIVLLFLAACVCLGLSDQSYVEDQYGKTYRLRLHKETHSLEFSPKYNSNVTILWKHGQRRIGLSLYYGAIWGFYELRYLTQKDSGRYTMRDKDQKLLSTKTIEVIANRRSYEQNPGESLSVTFGLEPNSCNIYFFSESDPKLKELETEIVRQGRLQTKGSEEVNCIGFQLSKPCGILIESLQMSCSGRFEVRDQNGHKALVASLKMKPLPHDKSYLGIGAGVFLATCFCGCLRGCWKSWKSSSNSETGGAAEPAGHYYEYDHVPVEPRPDEMSQPSGTHYPVQPSCTPTAPPVHSSTDSVPTTYSEVHNPNDNVPPAYSEVHNPNDDVPPAYSEVMAAAEQADAPTVPVYSDRATV